MGKMAFFTRVSSLHSTKQAAKTICARLSPTPTKSKHAEMDLFDTSIIHAIRARPFLPWITCVQMDHLAVNGGTGNSRIEKIIFPFNIPLNIFAWRWKTRSVWLAAGEDAHSWIEEKIPYRLTLMNLCGGPVRSGNILIVVFYIENMTSLSKWWFLFSITWLNDMVWLEVSVMYPHKWI